MLGQGAECMGILLKANEETIDVHLGPVSYIEGQNFNFEPGEVLEIKGDRGIRELKIKLGKLENYDAGWL